MTPQNPIIDNRIVGGITFALRLKDFVSGTQVNDPCSDEEIEYLLHMAEKLIEYQVATATDKKETAYLQRCGIITDKQVKP